MKILFGPDLSVQSWPNGRPINNSVTPESWQPYSGLTLTPRASDTGAMTISKILSLKSVTVTVADVAIAIVQIDEIWTGTGGI